MTNFSGSDPPLELFVFELEDVNCDPGRGNTS